MNEDVSALWRLAATIVVLSILISATLSVSIVGVKNFNEWQHNQTVREQVVV